MDNISNRQVHIFLSSTFADMQSERNHLIKHVFPALKTKCRKRNIDLNIIDLRWGITEEESKTGKVVEICIDEIDRTRPFFIGLLGGRYGWTPKGSDLFNSRKLHEKHPWVKNSIDEHKSITEMEMQYGTLNSPESTNAIFFIKEDSSIPQKYKETDPNKIEKLNNLKAKITNAAQSGKCLAERFSSTSDLGDKFYKATMELIDNIFPEESKNPLSIIDDFQKSEESALRKSYIENRSTIQNLDNLIESENRLIVVYGKPGSGKSALLANWRREHANDKNLSIIRMHIGNHLDTLKECCKYLVFKLSETYPNLNSINQNIINDNGEDFNVHAFFQSIQIEGKVIWIIDGIEKFNDDESKRLNWLKYLPDSIISIISTTDKNTADSFSTYSVLTMPELSSTEIIRFIEAYLKTHAKSLTDRQRVHISHYTPFRKPSTLVIFLEELLQFGIYEELDNYIEYFLSASNEEEFIKLILARYETDYGSSHLTTLLYTLSLTNYGLPESRIVPMLKCTNLEWAELYSALSPILSNVEGYINIKDGNIKDIIQKTYETAKDEVATRRTIIDITQKECKTIKKIQRQEFSISERFLLMLFDFVLTNKALSLDTENEYIFNRNQTELICQLHAIGDFKSLNKLFNKNIFNTTSLKIGIIDNLKIVKDLYAHGFRILRKQLTSTKITKLYFLYKNDLPTFELLLTTSILLYKNILEKDVLNKEYTAIIKNIKRAILIPKSCRQKLCDKIEGLGSADNMVCKDANIAETWIPNKDFNIIETILFANNIETMFSLAQIEEILEKAMAMTESKDSITCNLFYIISSLCLIRLGRYEAAKNLLSKIEVSDETELLKIRTTIDLFLFSKTDPENKLGYLINKFEQLQKALQIQNHPLKFYLEKYNLAYSLQKGDQSAMTRVFHYIETNFTTEELKNNYLAFAEWLYVLRYYEESNKFYKAAIETGNITEYERAIFYENIGVNSRRCGLNEKSARYFALAANTYKSVGNIESAIFSYKNSAKEYYKIYDNENCIKCANHILKIAIDNNDKAFAHNLIALSIGQNALLSNDKSQIDASLSEFAKAISLEQGNTELLKNCITIANNSYKAMGYMPNGIDILFNQWELLLKEESDNSTFFTLKLEYLFAIGKADEALSLIFNSKQNANTSLSFELIIKLCFASSNPKNKQVGADIILDNFKETIKSFGSSGNIEELTKYINYISEIANIKTVIEEIEKTKEKSTTLFAFLTAYYSTTEKKEQIKSLSELWKSAIVESKTIEEIRPFIQFIYNKRNKEAIQEFFHIAKCQDNEYEILHTISEIKDLDENLSIASKYIAEEISNRKDKVCELDNLLSYILAETSIECESSINLISAVSKLIKEKGQEYNPKNEIFPATPLINITAYTLMTILPILDNCKYENILLQCGITDIKPIYSEDYNNPDIILEKYKKISASKYFDKETILEQYNAPVLDALIYSEEYEKALILFEDYNDLPAEEIDNSVFIDKAFALLHCGRYSEALDEWIKFESLYPDEMSFQRDIYCKPLCLIYLGKFIDAYKEIETYEEIEDTSDMLMKSIIGITKSICLIEQGLINDGIKFFVQNNYQPTKEDLENDPIASKALNERICLYHISLCKYYQTNNMNKEASKELKILQSLKADSYRGIVKIQLEGLSNR